MAIDMFALAADDAHLLILEMEERKNVRATDCDSYWMNICVRSSFRWNIAYAVHRYTNHAGETEAYAHRLSCERV